MNESKPLGLYIHIPFCRQKCGYCDFYSLSGSEERMDAYCKALLAHLTETAPQAAKHSVDTVYFGGGTPSLLGEKRLREILKCIDKRYHVTKDAEITLEANPDSAGDWRALRALRKAGFNRISLGMQSADDAELREIGRVHSMDQVRQAVDAARKARFDNLSLDLIYGLPGETDERWEHDLRQAVALGVEHISAYHLTYEEGTPLYRMLQAHRVDEVDEDSSVRFFTTLMDTLSAAGYEHYEISNFCKPGLHSRHNTSYWQGIPYLGCGPSAHSFDTRSREWNIASLEKYISAIGEKNRCYEKEELSPTTRYNECVMTSLRTRQGIDLPTLEARFGQSLSDYCNTMAAPYLRSGKLELQNDYLRLTREGIFVSDGIISDLMFVEE